MGVEYWETYNAYLDIIRGLTKRVEENCYTELDNVVWEIPLISLPENKLFAFNIEFDYAGNGDFNLIIEINKKLKIIYIQYEDIFTNKHNCAIIDFSEERIKEIVNKVAKWIEDDYYRISDWKDAEENEGEEE